MLTEMCKKKILLTGNGSYIGKSFIKWLSKWGKLYFVDEISVRGNEWKDYDFSHYDVVVHLAGIAHVSTNPEMEELYYKVNRDLAIEVANKAKLEGIQQFIFMSSIIIYGEDGKIGESRVISKETEYAPTNFYGQSKLEADLAIQKMMTDSFKTMVIRTPVVYGPNCKGNFPRLVKLAEKSIVFPNIKNEKSMIFIDNLCEFMRIIIEQKSHGVTFPQNKEYVSTTSIIEVAAKILNKRLFTTTIANVPIKLLSKRLNYINKIFGNKVYDKSLSDDFNGKYLVADFEKSMKLTLGTHTVE